MSLPDSVQFPGFSITEGRVSFDNGHRRLSKAFHSVACDIADACGDGDEDALRLVRAYEHRLQLSDQQDRAQVDAKTVCNALAKVFHHGNWEGLKRSLDGELTERASNLGGEYLTKLHGNTPYKATGRPRAYAPETQAMMQSALSAFSAENALMEAITFDDRGWHAGREFVGGSPPALTETWSGTVIDLLDREILMSVHVPRPSKPWDYQGPTGSDRYAEARKKIGIITQQLMTNLVPNSGVAQRLAGVTRTQERELVRVTALTAELIDTLYVHHKKPLPDQVQSILDLSVSLAEVVNVLEDQTPAKDQAVVFLEYLRYALWIVRHVDVLAPFLLGHTVCYLLSPVHVTLLSALTIGGLAQSPRSERDREVRDSLPLTIPVPNALMHIPGFNWTATPRRN